MKSSTWGCLVGLWSGALSYPCNAEKTCVKNIMQSKAASLAESFINLIFGNFIFYFTNTILYEFYGVKISSGEHVKIAAFLSFMSIARSYAIRRLFNYLGGRNEKRQRNIQ